MVYSLDKTVQDYIQEFARTLLAPEITHVIWARPKKPGENASRPAKPYASLEILTPPALEFPRSEMVNVDDDNYKHLNRYLFSVTLNVYSESDDYMELVNRFSDQINFADTHEFFQPKKLAFYDVTNPVDLSELISTGWEYRAAIDLSFRWLKEVIEDTSTIHYVNIDGTGNAESGETIDININNQP